MCARFTLRCAPDAWLTALLPFLERDRDDEFTATRPRYNIAPTQLIWGVAASSESNALPIMLRWGLVPAWADDFAIGQRMINARSETAATKPAFRAAFAQRHCVIPADGYLEWTTTSDGQQPHLIEWRERQPFYFAGLWETNDRVLSGGEVVRTCTILTTAANSTTATIHHRMPVILDADGAIEWLKSYRADQAIPLPSGLEDRLTITTVSQRVNSVRTDDPTCLRPIARPLDLFD